MTTLSPYQAGVARGLAVRNPAMARAYLLICDWPGRAQREYAQGRRCETNIQREVLALERAGLVTTALDRQTYPPRRRCWPAREPHMPTIEDQAITLMPTPVLAEVIQTRTALGIAKYGQTLDDNEKPRRQKAVHFVQEMLDGCQYALWDGDTEAAQACAVLARRKVAQYNLSARELIEGGKA